MGLFDRLFKNNTANPIIENQENNIKDNFSIADSQESDLVEASYEYNCSELASCYRGRIFSKTGLDNRFPKLPDDFSNSHLQLYPFTYGVSIARGCGGEGNEIAYSNRPFIDNRTSEEITIYQDKYNKRLLKQQNENDYYWLLENLPELAPKSLGGYSRMKSSNSPNYVKIVAAAKDKEYIIN